MRRSVAGLTAVAATATLAAAGCGADEPSAPRDPQSAAPSAPSDAPDPPGEPPPPFDETESIRFADGTARSGLGVFRQVNGDPQKPYIVESVGGGVALFDADGDGALDVYLANGAYLDPDEHDDVPRDALFLGAGDGTFRAAPAEAGVDDAEWTCGVRTADVDGDGDVDVLLTGFGRDALLRNEGGRFSDVGGAVGLADERWTTGAAFLDHDADGDLDLYVVRHLAFDRAWIDANVEKKQYRGASVYFGPQGLEGEPDALYRNDDGAFVDVSEAAGVTGPARPGFQAVVFDQDDDGRPDIYVANDSMPNLMWRNQGGGTFADVADRLGIARSHEGLDQAGMGVAVGDGNGDARLDLYVTNFSEDYFTLYEADGKGFFRDRTRRAGLANPTMSSLGWSAGFHDLDLDGDVDLFAANGHVYPQMDLFAAGTRYRQRNQVFENDGAGRFREVASGGGLALEDSSRGAAFGDVDGDGDVDVVVSNLDSIPTLLINESKRGGAALRVRLEDSGPNRFAFGARVEFELEGRRSVRVVGSGAGFLSSDEETLTFGVPSSATPTSSGGVLRITWPDGARDEHPGLGPGDYVARRGGLSAR